MADFAGLGDGGDLGWDEADVNTLLLDIANHNQGLGHKGQEQEISWSMHTRTSQGQQREVYTA